MPLRITIELIPRGVEPRKRKLAVVNVENDGTAGDGRGNGEVGNYRVSAAGDCGEAGWDDFAAFTIGPLKRGNYVDTCAEVMASLHSQRTPENGSATRGVLSKLQEYEDALNEIYHATSCTTGQMEIINSVLPQRVDDGSNVEVSDSRREKP